MFNSISSQMSKPWRGRRLVNDGGPIPFNKGSKWLSGARSGSAQRKGGYDGGVDGLCVPCHKGKMLAITSTWRLSNALNSPRSKSWMKTLVETHRLLFMTCAPSDLPCIQGFRLVNPELGFLGILCKDDINERQSFATELLQKRDVVQVRTSSPFPWWWVVLRLSKFVLPHTK